MVFPLRGDKVKYNFREGSDFLINQKGDPRIICPLFGVSFSERGALLFFGENPFESEKYNPSESGIFQSSQDLRNIHSKTRRKLIRRVGYIGLGSLEAFVDDSGF
jgi:hypothetical protein